MLTSTQNDLVDYLARSICAIRQPDGSFDPGYALRTFATAATVMGLSLNNRRFDDTGAPAVAAADGPRLFPVLETYWPNSAVAAVMAYVATAQHFETPTDLLGLASSRLEVGDGDRFGEHFACGREFPLVVDDASQKIRAGDLLPERVFVAEGDRVGSSALALMAAAKEVCGSGKLAQCDFVVISDDPLALALACGQVACWMFAHPGIINDARFGSRCKDGSDRVDVLVRIGPLAEEERAGIAESQAVAA